MQLKKCGSEKLTKVIHERLEGDLQEVLEAPGKRTQRVVVFSLNRFQIVSFCSAKKMEKLNQGKKWEGKGFS